MKKIIVAVAAVAMMATSAYAADWNFYGSASVQTFWADSDIINPTPAQVAADLGTQANIANIGSANVIGANVKVSDELSARFEYDSTGVALRHLYGVWNFGAGTLTIGQTDAAFDNSISSQVYDDYGMGGLGNADTGRAALLKLTFGGFSIDVSAPNLGVSLAGVADTATGEAKIPQITASYKMNYDTVAFEIGGAYQTYEYNDAVDVDSWVIGAQLNGNFGAAYLAGNIFAGENAANLISMETSAYGGGATDGYAWTNGTTLVDNDAFGFQLVAGYAVNDMFSLEIGYGYLSTEYDVAGAVEDEACSYYIQAPITLAPGVTVTPEIGVFDYDETGDEEVTYFGANWKIVF